nr:thiol reductase thioredoxin [Pseudomonas tremae]
MLKTEFAAFVEEQITLASGILADKKANKLGDLAQGKLTFFSALSRVLQGEKNSQDLGMLDAINDSLQALDVLKSEETLLNYKKKSATVLTVKDDDDFNRKWSEVNPLVLLGFCTPSSEKEKEEEKEEKEKKEKEEKERKEIEAYNVMRTWAILDDLAPEFEGRAVMLRVPPGACPTAELNYNLTKAPTVIFFKNGKKIDETVNFHLKFWFRAKINELLGLAE